MEEDDPLPNDILRLIVEGRANNAITSTDDAEKTKTEKTEMTAVRPSSTDERGRRAPQLDDNLLKILAKRSHGVAILESDLVTCNIEDEAPIDFGPDSDDGQPGAYSGGDGGSYGRVESQPLPQHLRGVGARWQRHSNNTLGTSTVSVTDRTHEETDHATEYENVLVIPQASCRRLDPEKDVTDSTAGQCNHTRAFLCCGGLLLIAVVVVVVTTALLLGGDKDSELPETTNSEKAAKPSRNFTLVPNMTQYTLDALNDPHSYQSLAYTWIEYEDYLLWDTYEPWRKQQRFALACIYYSRIQEPAIMQSFPARPDECLWWETQPACNAGGKIVSLKIQRIDSITWKGLPQEVAFLKDMESIDFSRTELRGDLEPFLPFHLPNFFPALKELNLSKTTLSGSIPSTLGLLTSLTSLDLSQNHLTSTIPSELGRLPHLRSLVLFNNRLSGTTPEELGELSSLSTFRIEENTAMEEFTPSGFCEEDRLPMDLFSTSWCHSIRNCCSL